MHTGTISFCDRIAFNIKSSDAKDAILSELELRFGIRILQRHWFNLDDKSFVHIQRAPHLACLRSNGNPYYMYFTRFEDTPIVYFVDKKVQPGYEKPRIILAKGFFAPALFEGNGTVLEGEMVKDKNAAWLFLIHDIIGYCGQYLEKVPLPKRVAMAHTLFATQYRPDTVVDVCTYHVKKFAFATQNGIEGLLELSKELPYTNRGIYMYPFFLSYKPKLLNFDESLIKEVHRKVKDNPEFRLAASAAAEPSPPASPPKPCTKPNAVPMEEGERILYLRKTESPDVYDIFDAPGIQSANKMGIAHVPSLTISKMLRAVFKDLTVAVCVPFRCKFNDGFGKWTPYMRS